MKTRTAVAAALLVVAAIGLVAPALAASVACAEDGGTDCCGLDCAVCLCCSHGPQTTLSEPDGRSGGEDGRLRREGRSTPQEPLPRDILHVPKSAPSR